MRLPAAGHRGAREPPSRRSGPRAKGARGGAPESSPDLGRLAASSRQSGGGGEATRRGRRAVSSENEHSWTR